MMTIRPAPKTPRTARSSGPGSRPGDATGGAANALQQFVDALFVCECASVIITQRVVIYRISNKLVFDRALAMHVLEFDCFVTASIAAMESIIHDIR